VTDVDGARISTLQIVEESDHADSPEE
jgi:hypothetical protein